MRNKLYEGKRKRMFNEAWKKFHPWVVYDKEKDHMYCEHCRKFPGLADVRSSLYVGCGSNGKFREESLKFHSQSKAHRNCSDMENLSRQLGSAPPGPLETVVEKMSKKLDDVTEKRMKSLFNTAFYVGTKDTFAKFESLCMLQEKNGIDLGNMYKNRDKCKEFIASISEVELEKVNQSVSKSRFITVLADGATDSAVVEQETVFVRYINPNTGFPTTDFVDIVPIKHANADGVLEGILEALKNLDIDENFLKSKLIGCNFDGASVMLGKKGGVAVKLEEKAAHNIIKIHCVAHNLELGFLDAVKSLDYMTQFQNTLQQIYKFYCYSPKRKREMKEVALILEECQIMQTGLQKARWVESRHRAVKAVINSLPTIVTHFQNSSTGKGDEAAKVKGYLREITSSKFLHFAHVLCDVLSVLSDLSKQFQSDLLTINDVKAKIGICLLKLEELKHKTGEIYSKFLQSYNANDNTMTCGKNNI